MSEILSYVVFASGCIFLAPLVAMCILDVPVIDGSFWKTWLSAAIGILVFSVIIAVVCLFIWSANEVIK